MSKRNLDLIARPVYYTPMPVNAEGHGPADPHERVGTLHEVWDQLCQTVCSCPSEDMARRVVDALNRGVA